MGRRVQRLPFMVGAEGDSSRALAHLAGMCTKTTRHVDRGRGKRKWCAAAVEQHRNYKVAECAHGILTLFTVVEFEDTAGITPPKLANNIRDRGTGCHDDWP